MQKLTIFEKTQDLLQEQFADEQNLCDWISINETYYDMASDISGWTTMPIDQAVSIVKEAQARALFILALAELQESCPGHNLLYCENIQQLGVRFSSIHDKTWHSLSEYHLAVQIVLQREVGL